VSQENHLQRTEKEKLKAIKENEKIALQKERAALLAAEKERLRESKIELSEKEKNELIRVYEKQLQKESKRNKSSYGDVLAKQKLQEEIKKNMDDRQNELVAEVEIEKREVEAYNRQVIERNEAHTNQEKQRISDEKEQQQRIIKERAQVNLENTKEIEARKNQVAEVQSAASAKADERVEKARTDLGSIRSIQPKDYNDYYLSMLARDYPQGVTEESDNHGNKVIIRRIVVQGNKADEYRKVIDKTGKYYFKNGNSISELTWNQETNPERD
jgi:hypothetical protein